MTSLLRIHSEEDDSMIKNNNYGSLKWQTNTCEKMKTRKETPLKKYRVSKNVKLFSITTNEYSLKPTITPKD